MVVPSWRNERRGDATALAISAPPTTVAGTQGAAGGGTREAVLTADHNAEMLEQRARLRWVRDRSVFVGDADDVVPMSFGPGLPAIREWTVDNYDFAGYVTGFTPPDETEHAAVRRRLGCGRDELLCVVTVGGSGAGAPLLHRVLAACDIAVVQVD